MPTACTPAWRYDELKAHLKKHPAIALVLTCYAVGLVVFLAVRLWGFVQNRLAYANGTLQTASLALDDFDLHDLELQEDGTLLSVGGDPQLLLKDQTRKVENVTIHFSYRLDPVLVNAFWADPGADYSARRMAYGAETADGLRFWLPAAGGQSLRLDPGTKVGNTITVHSITANEKRPFYAFFIPAAGESFMLCVLPALFACGLWLVGGALPPRLRGWRPRRRKKAGAAYD